MTRLHSYIIATIVGFFILGACSHSNMNTLDDDITTKELKYSENDLTMVGFLAKPKNINQSTPAVLVVHEWWGQTDYPRMRVKKLAQMGYIAFAVDMYGNRRLAEHPKEAGAFSKKVMSDSEKVSARFKAAMEALKKVDGVDHNRLAAMGYCFGGSVVLEMMRQGLSLEGFLSFHGGLMTPTKAQKTKNSPKVLVFNGKEDPMVKKDHIESFKKEMKKAQIDFEFVSYANATHGFTNPEATTLGKKHGLPIAYNKKADKKSWNKTEKFLAEIFEEE